MRRLIPAFGLSAILLGCPSPAPAWQTTIMDAPGLPSEFVAVDKSSRHLFLLARRSPLTVEEAFPSIHGRIEGDKQVEGDLRTPEGVYFVRGKIQAPLDFDEYGSQAHALNYPNPVDRLRGKTGYGIWIHSKGRPIANQKTQGCIAIDLDDIDRLAPRLKPGTPVLVAQRVDGPVLRASSVRTAQQNEALPSVVMSPDQLPSAQPAASAEQTVPLQTAQLSFPASMPSPERPAAVELPAEAPADSSASFGDMASAPSESHREDTSRAVVNTSDSDASFPEEGGTDSVFPADLALPSQEKTPIPAVTETATEESVRVQSNLPVLFDSSALSSVADETSLQEVARRSAEWNRAWADRSPSFFDL